MGVFNTISDALSGKVAPQTPGTTVSGPSNTILGNKGAMTQLEAARRAGLKQKQEEEQAAALQKVFDQNKDYIAPGDHNYRTNLDDSQEFMFRMWLQRNNVPFDPDAPVADYDMRGFWKAMKAGDAKAKTAVNPNDKKIHYPDYWKTPYHRTFSNESQWAGKKAPKWNDKDQLVAPDGTIIFDEKAREK
jgi:hypothetical protein